MLILPIRTPLLQPGDDLAAAIAASCEQKPGDIVAVSAKAAATCEGRLLPLASFGKGDEAFQKAVLAETERMHGTVLCTRAGVMLTELRPCGLGRGTLLVANAGLDRSNAPEGFAIGWPEDPVVSVRALRKALGTSIILTDSCCHVRRLGVTAMALAVSGLMPFRNQEGERDLFGRTLKVTQEAVADQLATAANLLMGNAAQSAPAALIRDHGIVMADFEGWVDGIDPKEDMFPICTPPCGSAPSVYPMHSKQDPSPRPS